MKKITLIIISILLSSQSFSQYRRNDTLIFSLYIAKTIKTTVGGITYTSYNKLDSNINCARLVLSDSFPTDNINFFSPNKYDSGIVNGYTPTFTKHTIYFNRMLSSSFNTQKYCTKVCRKFQRGATMSIFPLLYMPYRYGTNSDTAILIKVNSNLGTDYNLVDLSNNTSGVSRLDLFYGQTLFYPRFQLREFNFVFQNDWVANAQISSWDSARYTFKIIDTSTAILPLKLLSFNIRQEVENKVSLNWQTSNEINVSHFNIERSTNGKDFIKIKKVEVKDGGIYSISDKDLPNTNTLYYRLQIVDKDGTSQFSNIQTVNINEKVSFIIFPNPAKKQVTIKGNYNKIEITDNLGKAVLKKVFDNKQTQTTLDISQLTKGIYYINCTRNDNNTTEKLIIE